MLPILLLLLLFGGSTSWALYEDQLGKFDWHRRGVGRPIAVSLHPRKPRLIAATEANVLTHLHLRDGAMQWRQKLDHPIQRLDVSHRDNAVWTVTSDNSVRGWSQTDGAIRWERSLPSPPSAMHFIDDDAPTMLYCTGEALELRDRLDAMVWSTRVEALVSCQGSHSFAESAEGVTLISQCRDGRVLLTSFDASTGKDVSTKEFTLEEPKPMEQRGILNGHLVLASPRQLCILDVTGASSALTCHITNGVTELFRQRLVTVDADQGQAMIQEIQNGVIRNIATIHDYRLHSAALQLPDHEAVAFLCKNEKTGWKLDVYDLWTGAILHSEDTSHLQIDLIPQLIVSGSYLRKNATMGYRFVIVSAHGDVLMLQQGQKVWERHEGLSSVASAVFVDPPMHGSHHLQADPAKWIRVQFLTLKVQFQLNTAGEKEQLAEWKRDLSGKHLSVKDASGYRKFIVCLTADHSVVALHNGDGRVVWETRFSPDEPPFDGLVLWSYAHGEGISPKVLLYRKGSNATFAILDAHSGAVLTHQPTHFPFTKILKLPHPVRADAVEQSVFVLIDTADPESPVGSLLPPLESPDPLDRFVFWDVEAKQGVARGFRIDGVDLDRNRLTFLLQWRLDFYAPIVSLAQRGANDPVHSYTKVLGNRSLLFKYLNPNTALLVTANQAVEFDDAFLEVFLIDTVTGRVLVRQVHESAKGPVHSVISQHWAVYHYWSISNQRFQMSTLELYDASHRPLTLSDLLFQKLAPERLSSYDPIPVRVFNATFFVSSAVTSLAVTKTQKGITTQLLLMGTVSDQIYAMNKKFLDPRRPIRPTQQTKDERLIPYSEHLPLMPTHYASHHYDILALRGLHCAAAGLESGTHLFAFGDDLFYTRLQPERGFDTLDEDFNYAFLLLTLMAMLLASVVCHYLVRDAKLSHLSHKQSLEASVQSAPVRVQSKPQNH